MGYLIKFKGVGNKDVYNISACFTVNNKEYILGRVEDRDSYWNDLQYNPQSMFFVKRNNEWILDKNLPSFDWEDPFISFIDNEIIVGGVKVFGESTNRKFKTVFAKATSLKSLKEFTSGPEMMKDIRLVQLKNKKIGVFTRPMGQEYKRGRIGFTVIDSIKNLNQENILKAKIIESTIKQDQWEGVNQATVLKNNNLGVLAHLAYKDSQGSHYKATTFIFNPQTLKTSNFKIIAQRSDFPETPAKNESLKDVVFPGGIQKINDKCYYLYAGLSDAYAGFIKINNPYI